MGGYFAIVTTAVFFCFPTWMAGRPQHRALALRSAITAVIAIAAIVLLVMWNQFLAARPPQ